VVLKNEKVDPSLSYSNNHPKDIGFYMDKIDASGNSIDESGYSTSIVPFNHMKIRDASGAIISVNARVMKTDKMLLIDFLEGEQLERQRLKVLIRYLFRYMAWLKENGYYLKSDISPEDFLVSKDIMRGAGSINSDPVKDFEIWNISKLKTTRNSTTGVLSRLIGIFKGRRDPMISEIENGYYFVDKLMKLFEGKRPYFLYGASDNFCKHLRNDELLECFMSLSDVWIEVNFPRFLQFKRGWLKMLSKLFW
jgi:hypothetical protein